MSIIALAFLLACVARFVMRPARHCTFAPQDDAQRLCQFRDRLDAEIGLRTSEYEAMLARGIAAKRKLLAQVRNRGLTARTPDWLLFGLQRIGDGPMTRVRLHATPLKSLLIKPQPAITVRKRERLSLAR
jgi:hypothetical protein